jgi:hypothetical protein
MAANRALLVVACVAAVVLAGCGGLTGDGDVVTPTGTDGPTTNGTTTPTATPADGTDPADRAVTVENPPPGLNESAIVDVDALLAAHRAAVTERGAVTVTNVSVDGPQSSLTSNATVRWGADGTITTNTVNDVGRGSVSVQQFTNGSLSAIRQEAATGTTLSVFEAGGYVERQAGVGGFKTYLLAGEFVPTSVDGGTVTLEAVGVDEDVFGTNVSTFDATVVVDQRGRLLSMEATVVAVGEAGESTTTIDYEMTETELPSAERPSWVDDAVADADVADLRIERVGGTVAITNDGEEALPTGTFVSVASAGGFGPSTQQYVVRLTDPLQPGETAYVYRPSENARQGEFSIGERPDGATVPIEGPVQVVVSGGGQIVAAATVNTPGEANESDARA